MKVKVTFISYLVNRETKKKYSFLSAKTKAELFECYDMMVTKDLFDLIIEKHTSTIEQVFPL